MKTNLIGIGNSWGVRIPKSYLKKCRIGTEVGLVADHRPFHQVARRPDVSRPPVAPHRLPAFLGDALESLTKRSPPVFQGELFKKQT